MSPFDLLEASEAAARVAADTYGKLRAALHALRDVVPLPWEEGRLNVRSRDESNVAHVKWNRRC